MGIRGTSRPASLLLAGAGLIALLGLASHLIGEDLLFVFPEPTPMKGNAALALCLVTAGCLLDGRRAGRAMGACAALIGGLTLLEYVASTSLGIDELLFGEFATGAEVGPHPGRMPPTAAAAFLLLGGAIAWRSRWALVPAALAFLIGMTGVFAYTEAAARALVPLGENVLITLPSALCLALVAASLVLGREGAWLGRRSVGGTFVRRFGPIVVLLPVVLGALWLQGVTAGLFEPAAGVWLLSLIPILVGGVGVMLVSGALDRTEASNAAALADREAHIRRILASAHEAFVSMDASGRIVEWNAAAAGMFGWSREEVVGRRLAEVIVPEALREAHRQGLQRFLSTGETTVAGKLLELPALHRAGHEVPVELTITVLSDEDGWHFHAFIRDVTERSRVESERELEAAELARSNAELAQFAYVASHDLSEPLRVISGFVQLLARRYEGRLDEDADRFIEATVSGTKRMQAMVDGMLSYSRVGRSELKREPVDTERVAHEAVEVLARAIEEKHAEVHIGDLPEVVGEPVLLGRLFQNLVSNAVKFSNGDHPVVEISGRVSNGGCEFSVRDNGEGVAPEYRDRIFEMFKRLHDREQQPGTGIGLAISQRIVERHGGRIWVDGAPDGGSDFRFTVSRSGESDR